MAKTITGTELKALIEEGKVIENGAIENCGALKYDFVLSDDILKSEFRSPRKMSDLTALERRQAVITPGEVVYVLSKEVINIPKDMYMHLSANRMSRSINEMSNTVTDLSGVVKELKGTVLTLSDSLDKEMQLRNNMSEELDKKLQVETNKIGDKIKFVKGVLWLATAFGSIFLTLLITWLGGLLKVG